MSIKSFQEIYDDYINELQSQESSLTDTSDGSIIDINAGVTSLAVNEIARLVVDEFRKTYFKTANGPEVTGDVDELENLAVDHFGDAFKRPGATKSSGVVTFSRPNNDAGDVEIIVGTVVKTAPDANGISQRFEVISPVTLVGTSINASIRALTAGVAGNVLTGTITLIETSLTDPTVTCSNASDLAGGAETQNDSEYLATIQDLIATLQGATLSAVEAKARLVDGVVTATAIEYKQIVIEWDISTASPVGNYFKIPRVKLFIADANGVASAPLIADVNTAIDLVRAAGVRIEVIAATAFTQAWTATITLNPSGPNFGVLQTDASMILDDMEQYIQNLGIGEDFNIAAANAAILALWGPAGTDDITAFTTSVPTGNVSVAENIKLLPGVMSTT